jgi:hypothetical protein
MTPRSPQHAAALAVVERGWHVFPTLPGRKSPSRELTDWEHRATNDLARVDAWWGRHRRDNPAVACGPSGLVVVDLDRPKPDQPTPRERWAEWTGHADGLAVFATLAARAGQALPVDTYTVTTPSGGRHLYFTAPPGQSLRSTWGRLGWLVDTRAAGGYVLGAGAVVNGRAYVVEHDAPVAELPSWLATLLRAPIDRPPIPTGAPVLVADRYAAVALAGECARARSAPKGQRHWELNKAAWNLSRHVAAGRLDRWTVEAALQQAGEAAGRAPNRVAATIRSALNAGLRRHGRGDGR